MKLIKMLSLLMVIATVLLFTSVAGFAEPVFSDGEIREYKVTLDDPNQSWMVDPGSYVIRIKAGAVIVDGDEYSILEHTPALYPGKTFLYFVSVFLDILI